MKRLVVCAICICLLAGVSCNPSFPGLELGLSLVRAVDAAPEGQKLCAAFEVLEAERNGSRLAALVNGAASRKGSDVRITNQQGDQLIELVRLLDCELLQCLAPAIRAQDPPEQNADIPAWLEERAELIRSTADCLTQIDLTESRLLHVTRLMVALNIDD